MLCSNCGSNVNENDVFCSICGCKVSNNAQQDTTAATNETNNNQQFDQNTNSDYSQVQNHSQSENYSQAQNQSQAQNYTQSENFSQAQNFSQTQQQGQPFIPGNFQPNPVPPQAPKKKFGAGKIIAIAGGVVVVAAVATIGTFAATGRLNNFIHKNFTSPESYFKYVTHNTADESLSSFNTVYTNAVESLDSSSSISGNYSFKLEAGDELKPLLGLIDKSLTNLDNASISLNTSMDDATQNLEIQANVNDSKIATIKATIDIENEEGYIQIPELSDSYIDISDSLEDIESSSAFSDYDEVLEQINTILPDAETVDNIINTYVDIAIDNVKDVEKSSVTIKTEGVSQNLTALKTTIDGKYCYNTTKDALKTLKDDENIKEIIESIDSSVYDEFQESIEDAIDEIEDEKDSLEDIDAEVNLTLYIDNKGEIVGTEVVIEDDDEDITVSSVMPKNGSKFGYEMKASYNDDVLFSITGSGTLKNDTMNGEFSVSLGDLIVDEIDDYVSDGEEIVTFEVKDFNTKEVSEGKLNGTFSFSSDSISEIKGYALNVAFESTDNETSAAISITSNDSEWATLTISAATDGDEPETLEPSNNDDVYSINSSSDIEEYLENSNLESFVKNAVDKSGIDIDTDDIIESIEDLFYDDDSYYYDYDYYYDYEW